MEHIYAIKYLAIMEDKLLLAVAVVALVAVLSTLKSLIVTNWAMDTAVDRQHPPPC